MGRRQGRRQQNISYRSAALLFILGTILYASNSTILVLSKGDSTHIKFHLSAVVFFAEALRLFGALFLVLTFGYTSELSHFFTRKLFSFALPAFIYAINDEIAFRCMEHMDSATFQTLSNFKILTTAILCYFFLGHQVTKRQWLALGILTLATIGGAASNTFTSGGSSIYKHEMHHHHTHHHHHFKRISTVAAVRMASRDSSIVPHHRQLEPNQILPSVTHAHDYLPDDSTHLSSTSQSQPESSVHASHQSEPHHQSKRRSLLFGDGKTLDSLHQSRYKYSRSREIHKTVTPYTIAATIKELADEDEDDSSIDANSLSSTSTNATTHLEKDELESAIAEHRFFITREGIFLVAVYSVLSAIAAAYSEWLLRAPQSSSKIQVQEGDGKSHGILATPANETKHGNGVYRKDLEKVTQRRMLVNSPSSATPLGASNNASPSPASSSSSASTVATPHSAGVHPQDIETPPPTRTQSNRQTHGRTNSVTKGGGSAHRFFLTREAMQEDESLPTKMTRIYFWGMIFSIFHCILELTWQFENYGTRSNILDGFNTYTWILIANQALMGLVLTAIIHQMGAISKLFLLSLAMILTSIVTIFAFHLIPNFLFCVSFACIVGSILLYNHEEFFEKGNDQSGAGTGGSKGEVGNKKSEMTPMKKSMAKVANKLYAYMFAAMILFVLGGGIAASLSIHTQFEDKIGNHP